MNRSFLATLAVALSLAVSPVTWARGGGGRGGGGHSGFGSSHASSSSNSSSSGSSLGSGFGSSRSNVSSSSASVSRSSPSLGTALYNSQASRQAAATYNRPAPAPAPAPVYTNAGGTGDYSGSASTGNRYNSPAPIVVHHYDNSGSGSSNFLFGWMLGHESSRSAPVVIEQRPSQPVYVQSGSIADTGSQPASNAGSSTGAIAPSVAHTGSQILHVLLWIAGIGVIGFASYRLWTNWSARKDSYTATNHYKL